MNKITMFGIIATVIGMSAPAYAGQVVKAEAFGNTKGVLAELKAGTNLGETPLDYFARVRAFRGYDGKNSTFMNNELGVPVLGLQLVGQARLVKDQIVPQAGVAGSTSVGDVNLYGAVTSSIQPTTVGEFLGQASYPVGKLALEFEQVVFGNGTLLGASTRAHVGYKVLDGIVLGAAVEADYGKGRVPEYRPGLFVRGSK